MPLDRAECGLLRSGSNIGKGAYGDELRRCEGTQRAVNGLGKLGMARDGSGYAGGAGMLEMLGMVQGYFGVGRDWPRLFEIARDRLQMHHCPLQGCMVI